MSKRVVIAGAGGFGRGVYSWLQQSPRHRATKHIGEIVFLDDATHHRMPLEAPLIGTIREYVPEMNDEILVAIGKPRYRREIVNSFISRNVQFHTFVDDRAVIAEGVDVGIGSIICPGTVISADATVGSHVHINFNSAVGHDSVLGDFATLSPMSNIMGETTVGSDVFVGGSAVILPRITIASGAIIGAGATVVQSIESPSTVVGNPAADTSVTRKVMPG